MCLCTCTCTVFNVNLMLAGLSVDLLCSSMFDCCIHMYMYMYVVSADRRVWEQSSYFLLVVITIGEYSACVIVPVVTCCSCLLCLQAMLKATEDDEDYTAFESVSDLWIKQI